MNAGGFARRGGEGGGGSEQAEGNEFRGVNSRLRGYAPAMSACADSSCGKRPLGTGANFGR